jgi:hypothetical protein
LTTVTSFKTLKTLARSSSGVLVLAAVAASGCRQPAGQAPAGGATPVYNKQTGRLELLLSDKNGDGRIDTRAHMDGVRLKMIELDLNGDGRTDRWEYYAPASGAPGATMIDRVEEAARPNGVITRREFYVAGALKRSEEDTDLDGRVDKWELYEAGQLVRVDLDLNGQGYASRRLIYTATGTFDHVEEDADGDGKFEPVPPRKIGGEGS